MILSIESSCDDSSIAVTCIDTKKVLFHKKISQELEHSKYGGVVPELAARLHAEALPDILLYCKKYFSELKAVAVTSTPGLTVSLVEGISMAKALSITLNIPIISVNHLKGHIYSVFIEKIQDLPALVLLVSGGHTQLIDVKNLYDMKIVGQSEDDSFGESFDKVSKMLGLGYPGGPIVEKYALDGDENRFDFPIPLRQSSKIHFSYSGLKNAVRVKIIELEKDDKKLSSKDKCDICACFQKAAIGHISMKLKKYLKTNNSYDKLFIVGGASANFVLVNDIKNICKPYDMKVVSPKIEYCSDNAVMIGRVAIEQYENNDFVDIEKLDAIPKQGIL